MRYDVGEQVLHDEGSVRRKVDDAFSHELVEEALQGLEAELLVAVALESLIDEA